MFAKLPQKWEVEIWSPVCSVIKVLVGSDLMFSGQYEGHYASKAGRESNFIGPPKTVGPLRVHIYGVGQLQHAKNKNNLTPII